MTLHSKQKRQKKGISEGRRQLYRDAASWNDTDTLQLGKEQKEQRELWRIKKKKNEITKIRFDHVADNGIFSCLTDQSASDNHYISSWLIKP